jgi:formylglycine-generating enzyme required for sulfatase activity
MRRSFACGALMASLFFPNVGLAQEVSALRNGVVKINSTSPGGKSRTGTGFVVKLEADTAFIVTAYHVVEGDKSPKVEFFARPNIPVPAEVVGTARQLDVALIVVRGKANLPEGLLTLQLDPEESLTVGQDVMTIGFPPGLSWAVSKPNVASQEGGSYAIVGGNIDEGNSGGPVLRGESVVAMVTAAERGSGRVIPAQFLAFVLQSWRIDLAATTAAPTVAKDPNDTTAQSALLKEDTLEGVFDRMELGLKTADESLFKAQWHPTGYELNLAGGSGIEGADIFRQGSREGWYIRPDPNEVRGRGSQDAYVSRCDVVSWKSGSIDDVVYAGVIRFKGRWAVLAIGEDKSEISELVNRARSGEPIKPISEPTPEAGAQTFGDCNNCPDMVVVPAGRFTMGSPQSEAGRNRHEGPTHEVVIPAPFAVSRYEVTRGQFAQFVRETGRDMSGGCWILDSKATRWRVDSKRSWRDPGFPQTDEHPVVCVNWEDAKTYTQWLAEKTGKPYRLLSEAEWEYVARANSETARFWGDGEQQACEYANVADRQAKNNYSGWTSFDCDDGYTETAPVGTYKPNAFGLHDMLGNAWEWVEDCWIKSYAKVPNDGSAWLSGDCKTRVLRGGSWSNDPNIVRSAFRNGVVRSNRKYFVNGFRVAKDMP